MAAAPVSLRTTAEGSGSAAELDARARGDDGSGAATELGAQTRATGGGVATDATTCDDAAPRDEAAVALARRGRARDAALEEQEWAVRLAEIERQRAQVCFPLSPLV